MNREVRIVKLRGSGIKARITVIPDSETSFLVGNVFAPNLSVYKSQIIYYFCENLLREVIPALIGSNKTYRKQVFDELFKCIEEYNPEINSSWRPIALSGDFPVTEIVGLQEDAPRTKTVKVKSGKTSTSISIESVKNLTAGLSEVIFGQEEALETIQQYFEISFAGLRDPRKPRGCFLFVGNTGTGKTATVKEMAKHFWGDAWETGLFTINGSEYLEDHETSKLLGSPPSYVGYEDGSALLKHVTANPESIILVDEFEKASSRLQDVFLQILDDGTCYDNKGNRIDFSKTFIVFTSNIGTKEVYHKNPVGFSCGLDEKCLETSVNSALSEFCRVEFLKRFDGVVTFKTLKRDSHVSIVKAELAKVNARLADKDLLLTYADEVVEYLVDRLTKGDTARDLGTIVSQEVVSPAAKLVIGEKKLTGIAISLEDGAIEVRGVPVGIEEETGT